MKNVLIFSSIILLKKKFSHKVILKHKKNIENLEIDFIFEKIFHKKYSILYYNLKNIYSLFFTCIQTLIILN